MMSAAQFSSKMLKDLKEQRFCRKVWRTQRLRSPPKFSFKMLKNLKEQGFCTKVLLAQRQLSEVFSCKDKLCSFCELPAWWKTSQTPLLTKIRDFESTETSKTWNLKRQILLTVVYELPAWWKSTQTHLLTKVRDFDRSAASKTWKCKFYSFFHTLSWWKLFK